MLKENSVAFEKLEYKITKYAHKFKAENNYKYVKQHINTISILSYPIKIKYLNDTI